MDKTASLQSNPSVPDHGVDLSLDQTVTVVYKIVVKRTATRGSIPTHSAPARTSSTAMPRTLATHLFLGSQNLHESATFTYSRDIGAHGCASSTS